jgi:hypothetical protein
MEVYFMARLLNLMVANSWVSLDTQVVSLASEPAELTEQHSESTDLADEIN